jgi:hypothetical protein
VDTGQDERGPREREDPDADRDARSDVVVFW